MAMENVSDVKQIITEECCLDPKPMVAEESSVETIPVALSEESTMENILPAVSEVQKDIREIHEVSVPDTVNQRRCSTRVIAVPPGKLQVKPRYLGNSSSSYHDICKHGKRDEKDVVKPWKMVRKKINGVEDVEKTETLGVRRKPLDHGCRQISSFTHTKCDNSSHASRDALVLKKQSCSAKPGSSSSSGVGETKNFSSDSVAVMIDDEAKTKSSTKKGVSLRNEKRGVVSPSVSSLPRISVKRVPRSSSANSSFKDEASPLKNQKSGRRTKVEPDGSEDVPEKTLYVVESSIEKKSLKSVHRGTQRGLLPSPSGKRITRSGPNDGKGLPSLKEKDSSTTRSETRLMRQSTKSKTSGAIPSLHKRKETGCANLTADPKTENKNRSKRIWVKITSPARQLSFRRGKVIEPLPENSAPRLLRFRKRVIQESPGGHSSGKKNLKGKQDGERKSNATEGKTEKVVLRHRKVETKKKTETLFNNVIEETASKLAEVRKSKVKALVGAFETVISLQDNKLSRKVQSHSTKG